MKRLIKSPELRRALVRSYLGQTVRLKIDRPMGSRHPQYADLIYPVNYGYLPDVLGGDEEELDVYLLGVDHPVAEYTARVIGIVHRKNDVEDKLVAAPEGILFDQAEIAAALHFQEKYFESKIESIFEKSCGTILFTRISGKVRYLLLQAYDDGYCGFPKGHMEVGETEKRTALRETWEETSIRANLIDGFRKEVSFSMSHGKRKKVVYFLAEYAHQIPQHNPGFEHRNYCILPFESAYAMLTFPNTKNLLKSADEYLKVHCL